MKRRTLLKTAAMAAAGPFVFGAFGSRKSAAAPAGVAMKNDDYYTDGKFDEEKTKDAVLAMCERFGYPVFPGLRDQLWVSDYGTGRFAEAGLAAVIFANNYDGGPFMMLDIFLMPNQMLPEHWHLEGDHGIVKNEGWLVRWGKAYIGGAGEKNIDQFPAIRVPDCHSGGTTTTHHVVEATPGMFVPLAEVGTRHWQFGGPEGAILTEVANFHTGSAVRHSDKAMNEFFLSQ